MEWDLKETEALTTARLMAASPEFVYEQLKFYGEHPDRDHLWGRRDDAEAALLTRDNKLINLALAQFAFNNKVVKALYDRANSGTNDKDEYNLGLRIACLSNRNFARSSWSWRDFDLKALFGKVSTYEWDSFGGEVHRSTHPTIECGTLLKNPTIDPAILEALYRKSEYFAEVDEQIWLAMVALSASNERLLIDDAGLEDPDYGLWMINAGIFNFLEAAPVSDRSSEVAKDLLDRLVDTQGVWPDDIAPVLKRWGEVEVKDRKGEPEAGWFTSLTHTQELRCLIAALYGPDVKVGSGNFGIGSPDDPDVAMRCAFYAGGDLSEKEMEAGFRRDKEIFVYAALKRSPLLIGGLLFDTKKRALIKKYLDQWECGINLCYEYRRCCEQFNKRDKYKEQRLYPRRDTLFEDAEAELAMVLRRREDPEEPDAPAGDAQSMMVLRRQDPREKLSTLATPAGMLTRLGNVLYWAFGLLAGLILIIAWWLTANGSASEASSTWFFFGALALLAWLLGHACRYVLSGK